MTLDDWLAQEKPKGMTEEKFGQRIGRSQAAVNRYRRGRIPDDPKVMRLIVRVTRGNVTANDFYGIEAAQ